VAEPRNGVRVCSEENFVRRRVVDTSSHHGLKNCLMSRESSRINRGQLGESSVTKVGPPMNSIHLVGREGRHSVSVVVRVLVPLKIVLVVETAKGVLNCVE
jgi:hypothetical protein